MKYLADILTFARLIMAVVTVCLVLSGFWLGALITFWAAILSDALDGVCARRWPYTEDDKPVWRRNAVFDRFDAITDAVLVVVVSFALAAVIPYWWLVAVLIIAIGALLASGVQLLILAGRPDAAERIDVMDGVWYGISLGLIASELTRHLGASAPALFVLQAFIAVLIVALKWAHITTRPGTRRQAEVMRASE